MGRPSKLTDELIQQFCDEVAEGTPICYVCDLLYITEQTYYNWYNKGEEDTKEGLQTIESDFFEGIKNAYARYVITSNRRIKKGEPGWQGTAWWLERTNNKFMPKQQIQADEDGKVNVIIGGKVKK